MHKTMTSICVQLTNTLIKSLTYLIYSLLQPQVAIVTETNACADTFFTHLQGSVNNSIYRSWLEIRLTQAKIQEDWNRQLTESQYYGIKSGGFNVIILLTSTHLYNHVFSFAHHFSLLSAPVMWIIPNAMPKDLETEFQPARLLSFDVASRDAFMTKSFTKVNNIVESSIDFLEK